jgi:hypothetical protein
VSADSNVTNFTRASVWSNESNPWSRPLCRPLPRFYSVFVGSELASFSMSLPQQSVSNHLTTDNLLNIY